MEEGSVIDEPWTWYAGFRRRVPSARLPIDQCCVSIVVCPSYRVQLISLGLDSKGSRLGTEQDCGTEKHVVGTKDCGVESQELAPARWVGKTVSARVGALLPFVHTWNRI
jgi:hypothetical protein